MKALLDNLVFEIIRDLDGHGFSKTATRQDIDDLVLDYLKNNISELVLSTYKDL